MELHRELSALLEKVIKANNIDPAKVYLTGEGTGGIGVFYLAAMYPERFTAIAPVGGIGDPILLQNLYNTPAWIFNSKSQVPIQADSKQDNEKKLKQFKKNAKYATYADTEKNITDIVYTKSLFDWFINTKKSMETAVGKDKGISKDISKDKNVNKEKDISKGKDVSKDKGSSKDKDSSKSQKNSIVIQIKPPQILINGSEMEEIEKGKQVVPIIKNGTVLMPLQNLITLLGGNYLFDNNENKITVELNSKKIEMWINSRKAVVDTEEKNVELAPKYVKESIFMPLNFVMESAGYTIEVDETEKKAIIYKASDIER